MKPVHNMVPNFFEWIQPPDVEIVSMGFHGIQVVRTEGQRREGKAFFLVYCNHKKKIRLMLYKLEKGYMRLITRFPRDPRIEQMLIDSIREVTGIITPGLFPPNNALLEYFISQRVIRTD